MKQMTLIEMNGFLKGKCIPSDLKVNETNAEYLVRKFGELESKLETALRECRSAGITIDNLEAKCSALAAENAGLKSNLMFWDADNPELPYDSPDEIASECGINYNEKLVVNVAAKLPSRTYLVCESWDTDCKLELVEGAELQTPTTDAFLAEVRAQGVEMYADNLDNVADDAERGGFDYAVKFLRSEASSVRLFADQLRKGGNQ
ncbi:TPA: hypothetical protein JLF99_000515 [Escherichia coli]|nr:hypothetical protein [Escherichia coli]